MPSAAARRLYEDQIPSFMSILQDLDAEAVEDRTITVVDPKLMDMEPHKLAAEDSQQQLQPATIPSDPSHKHNDSTSTQNSESADSSPITTASLTSSLSDHSAGSSPDSPVTLGPLSTFPPLSFGPLATMGSLTVSETDLERPMTSPNPRKPKNMKGLSIQPPSTTAAAASLVSEPSSPSFIKPMIPAMKRKPSQLSLKTSSNDLITKTTLEIPLSPQLPPILQRRALKHSTSSPHMLSGLKSSTFGPVGGMTIPTVLERNESGLSEILRPSRPPQLGGFDSTILEEDSPIRTQIANRAAYEFEPYHEVENNEDQKTPGYPDGPIAIYGDNVYLYLEPTAEEAAKFDVVINVAREVLNPFKALAPARPEPEQLAAPVPAAESPIPDTAITGISYATAFEFQPDDALAATPTTPKAVVPFREPEYIHIPWDHNTDIGGDLMMLCEIIEKKTKEGKKVLVHCQQGASRSASLIIAYGLYMNPELSVNDAYHAAQAKSRWISPNMRLMYCLQDFQKEVSRKKAVPGSAFRPRTGRSPTKHRATLSADAIDIPGKEPLTAPLPVEEGTARSASPNKSPLRGRDAGTPGRGDSISPGPSSAPSSFSWTEQDVKKSAESNPFDIDRASQLPATSQGFCSTAPPAPFAKLPPPPPLRRPPPPPLPRSAFTFAPLDLSSRQVTLPLRDDSAAEAYRPERTVTTVLRSFADDTALMSPRVEAMTNNPLKGPALGNEFPGLHFVEVPPTPTDGLFSPRQTSFPRESLFRPFGRPAQFADPRSPPTKGEAPIVRSIDELL